jgi:enoyl-CoA hydratase/carnithine racemase
MRRTPFEVSTLPGEQLSLIETEQIDGIATIRMCGPRGLNVLSSAMLEALRQAFREVAHDESARCLLISGNERTFSAGADLREVQRMPPCEAYAYARNGQETLNFLHNLPIPSIALIQGFALGGGCELAIAATFRIATRDALLGLPELSLGLIPGFGGTQRLMRIVGQQKALSMVLTGQRLPGVEAVTVGLVDQVVDADELYPAGWRLANVLAQQPRYASGLALRAIHDGDSVPLDSGLLVEAEHFSKVFSHPDRTEGIAAFLEKRLPKFAVGSSKE